jgi:tetrahydromethanopterin S-methyltransferase subunit G
MTSDQFTELVVFLGEKFQGVERRLDGHDRQFEEVRRHATVLFERARQERRVMTEGVNARFERVDVRLDGVDHRLDGIEGRLDTIDGRLEGVDRRLDGLGGSPGDVPSPRPA